MTAKKTPQRAGRRVSLSLDRSGGANPADAAGANINRIVAQYRANGTLPNIGLGDPLYGDFTTPTDLQDALDLVEVVTERFEQLPADVRSAAHNNPVQLLDMVQTEAGREVLQAAGLIITTPPQNETPGHTSPSKASENTEGTPPQAGDASTGGAAGA